MLPSAVVSVGVDGVVRLSPAHFLTTVSSSARPILTGTGTFGVAAKMVLKHFGDADPQRFKSIRGRFTAPFFHGETFKVQMWKMPPGSGCQRIAYQVSVKERNVKALNGIVEIWDTPRPKL